MEMHSVNKQIHDASLVGVFFIKLRLIKGYRYKFRYIWRDAEIVDHDETALITVDKEGVATNYIEIENDDGKTTIADFIQQKQSEEKDNGEDAN